MKNYENRPIEEQFLESQEKKRGHNIVLDLYLARHGKKSSFNAARIDNPEEVQEMAKTMDIEGYDYVGVRTTPIERAVDTAHHIKEGFEDNSFMDVSKKSDIKVRVRNLSSGILSKDGTIVENILKEGESSKDINLISPAIREHYKQAVLAASDSNWDKENAGVNAFIEIMESEMKELDITLQELERGEEFSEEAEKEINAFKNRQFEADGISMLEVALRMSKHFNKYIESTKRFDDNSKILLYEVNHAGFIEPELAYLLREQINQDPVNPDGNNILEKLGGAFQPSEAVKISIKREDDEAPAEVAFDLRGKSYSLTIDGKTDIFNKSERLLKAISISDKILTKRHGNN
ncbi:MAG TPA: histidine phosphatase family protein [Patescibacteria group bacterium]|nr:histidine phosphatase family protein [Patescibacteria group bacterium]